MKTFKPKKIVQNVLTKVVCDACKKSLDLEFQPYTTINHKFVFSSDIDGMTVEIDLCEDCLVDLMETVGVEAQSRGTLYD